MPARRDLNAEGSGEGLLAGFAFGGSSNFKSLRFARLRRVWFVMVWMEEGGFIVAPWQCVSSPFRQHLAQGSVGNKPVQCLPRAVLTSPCCGGRERGSGAAQDALRE